MITYWLLMNWKFELIFFKKKAKKKITVILKKKIKLNVVFILFFSLNSLEPSLIKKGVRDGLVNKIIKLTKDKITTYSLYKLVLNVLINKKVIKIVSNCWTILEEDTKIIFAYLHILDNKLVNDLKLDIFSKFFHP